MATLSFSLAHMVCACRIWPIDGSMPVRRCGFCRERPHRYATEDEVRDYYVGRSPA